MSTLLFVNTIICQHYHITTLSSVNPNICQPYNLSTLPSVNLIICQPTNLYRAGDLFWGCGIQTGNHGGKCFSKNKRFYRGVFSSLQFDILPPPRFFNLVSLPQTSRPPTPLSHLIFFRTALALKERKYCFPFPFIQQYILSRSRHIPIPSFPMTFYACHAIKFSYIGSNPSHLACKFVCLFMSSLVIYLSSLFLLLIAFLNMIFSSWTRWRM